MMVPPQDAEGRTDGPTRTADPGAPTAGGPDRVAAQGRRAPGRHGRAMKPAPSARPPAVILAGGRASRMGGGDKGLLDLGGRPLLARVVSRLAPQCAALALNANGDPARLAAFGLPVLTDGVPGLPGPLAGILAGMDWAAALGVDRMLSAPGDTPFLPGDLAARLAAGGDGIVLAAGRDAGGLVSDHPAVGLWPVALRDGLRAFLDGGGRRVGAFARAHGAALAVWEAGASDPFFNINTPADLERARAMSSAERSPWPGVPPPH